MGRSGGEKGRERGIKVGLLRGLEGFRALTEVMGVEALPRGDIPNSHFMVQAATRHNPWDLGVVPYLESTVFRSGCRGDSTGWGWGESGEIYTTQGVLLCPERILWLIPLSQSVIFTVWSPLEKETSNRFKGCWGLWVENERRLYGLRGGEIRAVLAEGHSNCGTGARDEGKVTAFQIFYNIRLSPTKQTGELGQGKPDIQSALCFVRETYQRFTRNFKSQPWSVWKFSVKLRLPAAPHGFPRRGLGFTSRDWIRRTTLLVSLNAKKNGKKLIWKKQKWFKLFKIFMKQ